MSFIVDEIFAFIATDEDGDEGIMSAMIGNSVYPLVAADLTRIQQMVPIANSVGVPYKLKHYQLLGEVSDAYIEQFKSVPEPDKEADVPGDADTDERQPDEVGNTNGSGKNVH